MSKYYNFKGDLIGYDEVSKILEFDTETGFLYWRGLDAESQLPGSYSFSLDHWNNKRANKRAETTMPYKDYVRYSVKFYSDNFRGINVYAHRIAWLLYYGSWPDGYVDHVDGDATNNKIENLRTGTDKNNRNIEPPVRRGVKVERIKMDGYLTYFAWGRETGGEGRNPALTLYRGSDLFEAWCCRISWENDMLKDQNSGYTPRHFKRE